MKSYFEKFMEFIKSRLFIMLAVIFMLFSAVALKLFSLQIVHGEDYQKDLTASIMQELSIPASRGIIYDRYGRPLANNQAAFTVKLDDSVKISFSDKDKTVETLVTSYDKTDTSLIDNLPFSSESPLRFTFSDSTKETAWKKSIGLSKKQMDMSAEETMAYLLEKYNVPSEMDQVYKRKFLSLRIFISDKNLMLLSLIQTLDKNNETLVDDLPISVSEPYIFLFGSNETREKEWKSSIAMKNDQLNYNAAETMTYLESFFDIPQSLSPQMKRKMISLRYSLYLKRYRKYQPIDVALNISEKTIASIEENNQSLPGVTIDTSSLRNYTSGKYFSHILGYIRKIDDAEYAQLQDKGYSTTDIVGKSGVEKLYELELNGTDGEKLVEVDASGRRINTIETKQPVSGNNVFLTIDKNLQIAAYDYLEEELTNALIAKLTTTSSKNMPITLKEFFASMVECDTISLSKILSAKDGEGKKIAGLIHSAYPNLSLSEEGARKTTQQFIINSINNNSISTKQLVILLYEQGKITLDGDYLKRIENGSVSPLSVVISKLNEKELIPGDTNLDPCSGSVVVSDVNNGETLALVTYPSYDNNRLVNTFDNDYYSFLLQNPSTPLVNRPLREAKAPGSTFKMVSAMTILEEGAATPNTLIRDGGVFTNAGKPYARCWIYSNGGSHGLVNVSQALEVSCNYYFYELAYRMGNASNGGTLTGIELFNKYMNLFGLNNLSGIEIGESMPKTASPENKEEIVKWQNPDATVSQTRWTDGDTIRAVIGQSINNYAPIHMNKYIATLANGKIRYSSQIIDKVESADGNLLEENLPIEEETLSFKKENIEAVHKGMLLVTEGQRGTLRGVFNNYPIQVAGKSGTAQENLTRSSHTWFVGFAPYDEPQIAVTVMIPFGEVSGSPAAVVAKNIISDYMGLNYAPENSYLKNKLSN